MIDLSSIPFFGGPPAPPFSQPGNYPGPDGSDPFSYPNYPEPMPWTPFMGGTSAVPLPPFSQPGNNPQPLPPFSQPGNYPPQATPSMPPGQLYAPQSGSGSSASGGQPYQLQNVQAPNTSSYNNVTQPGRGQSQVQNQPPGQSQMQQPTPLTGPAGQLTPQIAEHAGSALVNNPDNPTAALTHILKSLGLNPNNPGDFLAKYLMQMAGGLGMAYKIQNADELMGSPKTIAGSDFTNFLTNALTGGHDVLDTLHNASQDLLGKVVPESRTVGNNADATQVKPYLQALTDMMSTGGGTGMTDILQALNSPGMSPMAQKGYESGLKSAQSNAYDNWGQGYLNNTYQGKDLWSYLLGMR